MSDAPGFFTDVPTKPVKKAPAKPAPKVAPKLVQRQADPTQTFIDQIGYGKGGRGYGQGQGVLQPGAVNPVPKAPSKPVVPINRDTRNKIAKSGNTQDYQNALNNPFMDPKATQDYYAKGKQKTVEVVDPIFGHELVRHDLTSDPTDEDVSQMMQMHYEGLAQKADKELPFAVFDFNTGLRNSRPGAEVTIKSKDGKRDIPIRDAIKQLAKVLNVDPLTITKSKHPITKFLNSLNASTSAPAYGRIKGEAMDEGIGKAGGTKLGILDPFNTMPDGLSFTNFYRAQFEDQPQIANDSDLETYGRSLVGVVNPFTTSRQFTGQSREKIGQASRMTEDVANFIAQMAVTGGVGAGVSTAEKLGSAGLRALVFDAPQMGLMVKDSGGVVPAFKGLAGDLVKPFQSENSQPEDFLHAGMAALMVFGLAHGVKTGVGRGVDFVKATGLNRQAMGEVIMRSADSLKHEFDGTDRNLVNETAQRLQNEALAGKASEVYNDPKIAHAAASIIVYASKRDYNLHGGDTAAVRVQDKLAMSHEVPGEANYNPPIVPEAPINPGELAPNPGVMFRNPNEKIPVTQEAKAVESSPVAQVTEAPQGSKARAAQEATVAPKPAPESVKVESPKTPIQRVGKSEKLAAPVGKGVWGSTLTEQRRWDFLNSLTDSYKGDNPVGKMAEKHEIVLQNGRTKEVFLPYQREYMNNSDHTGRDIRHFISTPYGKAHPSELFPDLSEKILDDIHSAGDIAGIEELAKGMGYKDADWAAKFYANKSKSKKVELFSTWKSPDGTRTAKVAPNAKGAMVKILRGTGWELKDTANLPVEAVYKMTSAPSWEFLAAHPDWAKEAASIARSPKKGFATDSVRARLIAFDALFDAPPKVKETAPQSPKPITEPVKETPGAETLSTNNGMKVTVPTTRGKTDVHFNDGRVESRDARLFTHDGRDVAVLHLPEHVDGPNSWYVLDAKTGALIATGQSEAGAILKMQTDFNTPHNPKNLSPKQSATATTATPPKGESTATPKANPDGSIFVRPLKVNEHRGGTARSRGMVEGVPPVGYERVYKPYGEQGKGYYDVPMSPEKAKAEYVRMVQYNKNLPDAVPTNSKIEVVKKQSDTLGGMIKVNGQTVLSPVWKIIVDGKEMGGSYRSRGDALALSESYRTKPHPEKNSQAFYDQTNALHDIATGNVKSPPIEAPNQKEGLGNPAKQKEPWEMTVKEFADKPAFETTRERSIINHQKEVKQALAEGKPVPAEVLKDYPDLAPKTELPPGIRAVRLADGIRYARLVDGEMPAGTVLHKTVEEAVSHVPYVPKVFPKKEVKPKGPKLSGSDLAAAGNKARQDKSLDSTSIRDHKGNVKMLREHADGLLEDGYTAQEVTQPKYYPENWSKRVDKLNEEVLSIFRNEMRASPEAFHQGKKRTEQIKAEIEAGNPRVTVLRAVNGKGSQIDISKAQYDYMTEKAKGQEPLFQNKSTKKGTYLWDEATQRGILTLNKNADASTVIHELQHHFLQTASGQTKANIASWALKQPTTPEQAEKIMAEGSKNPRYVRIQESFAYATEQSLKGKFTGPANIQEAMDAFRGYLGSVKEAFVPDEVNLNQGLEQVNPQTKTPEFKKWFGESKVVDEKGEPLTVYHGSIEPNLTRFDPRKAVEVPDGFFFTNREDVAHDYTYERAYGDIISDEPLGNVVPTYLSLKNPLEWETKPGQKIVDAVEMGRAIKEAKAKGHDGVVVRNIDDTVSQTGDIGDVYIAFEPTQIKSAIANSGKFDPKNPSILHQEGLALNHQGKKTKLTPHDSDFDKLMGEILGGEITADHAKAFAKEVGSVDEEVQKNAGTMTHAQTAVVREVLGAELYQKTVKPDEQTIKDAAKHRGKSQQFAARLDDGKPLSDSEQVALGLDYQDSLRGRQEILDKYPPGQDLSKEDAQALADHEYNALNAIRTLDKAGSEAGRSLRIRQLVLGNDYTNQGITAAFVKASGKMPDRAQSAKIAELTARIEELESKVNTSTKAKRVKYDDAVKYFENLNQKNVALNQLSEAERHANAIAIHLMESGMTATEAIAKMQTLTGGKVRGSLATNAVKKALAVMKGKNTRESVKAGEPTPREINEARGKIYNAQMELADIVAGEGLKTAWKEAGILGKTGIALRELRDSAVSVVSSTDFSGTRQALYGLLVNPKSSGRTFLRQFKNMKTSNYDEWIAGLQSEPQYWDALDNGLDIQGKPNFKEEAFRGRAIEKVPGIGQIVGASDRTYSTVTTGVRYEVYKTLAKYAKTKAEKALIADFANIVTGRAGSGKLKTITSGELPRSILWAPSFMASRMQHIALPVRILRSNASAGVKARLLGEWVKPIAAIGGIMAGVAQVTGGKFISDRDDKDFLAVILPDGTKYDPWAGSRQVVRLGLDMINPQRKGEWFDQGKDQIKRVFDFTIEGKSNPMFKTGMNLARRHDTIGGRFGMKEAALGFLPLMVKQTGEDAMDGMTQQEWVGFLGNTFGVFDLREKKSKEYYKKNREDAKADAAKPFLEYITSP